MTTSMWLSVMFLCIYRLQKAQIICLYVAACSVGVRKGTLHAAILICLVYVYKNTP